MASNYPPGMDSLPERPWDDPEEDADDPDRVITSACLNDVHEECPDIDANCCECSCHWRGHV